MGTGVVMTAMILVNVTIYIKNTDELKRLAQLSDKIQELGLSYEWQEQEMQSIDKPAGELEKS